MSGGPPSIPAALALLNSGRLRDGIGVLQRLLQRSPKDPEANHFLGMALAQAGEPVRAEYHLRRSIELSPARAQFQSNLGNFLIARGRDADAVACYRRAIELEPTYVPAHTGLSAALMHRSLLAEAETAAREAVRLAPASRESIGNLVQALMEQGAVAEATALIEPLLDDAHPPLEPALLAYLNYTDVDPAGIFRAHARAGLQVANRTRPLPPATPSLNHDGAIRVAFLSPDLRSHSVAYFLEPLLTHFPAQGFRIACYHTSPIEDETTHRLRALAQHWVKAESMTDRELAEQIRADRTDILIDLAGLSIGHRLSVLAMRPAPLAITMIGYPNTTGIPGVDLRIVDSITDPLPPHAAHALATERLLRLDPCFLCYRPPDEAPGPATAPPSAAAGHITFGSFNASAKLNERVLGVWAEVLLAVPDSRLVLKNRRLVDPALADRVRQRFAERGVAPGRIDCLAQAPGITEHLSHYSTVDIALDPFPYCGTTTTCEALWMGVPVVTLAGDRHSARVGASLLSAIGAAELIAESTPGYIDLARGLAAAPARIAAYRATLRDRLRRSPLCDSAGYSARLAALLRPECDASRANPERATS